MTPSALAVRAALAAAGVATLMYATPAAAQAPEVQTRDREVMRLQATPIGALPPLPLPMPASRDHNYLNTRIQAGYRLGRDGADLRAIAAGVDLQWLGGSTVGVTAGYQDRDCALWGEESCGGHLLASVGTRINVISGGPGPFGDILGDFSGTTTIGVSSSFGYAPQVLDGMDACTVDVGVPVSTAVFQKVRVTTFATPSVVWDLGCGTEAGGPRSYRFAAGVGVLQLGLRGLDVFVGGHRYLRSGTGYSFGISVVYVPLP